jgi:hypothetical protein
MYNVKSEAIHLLIMLVEDIERCRSVESKHQKF